jgi:bacillithiol biosynthesis cysteine-adding enzyme BshC
VSSHSDTSVAAGLLRDAVPFTRLPWMRALVHAYTHDFASIAPLFAGDPARPEVWRETIARVARAARSRDRLAAILTAQLSRRGAPEEARRLAAELGRADAVALVTGQQAGLFGGPLYTLFKAITTVQLARRTRDTHGVPVVPVFWVDAEDHDWDEVATAHLLDRDSAVAGITLGPLAGCRTHPVASLTLDGQVETAVAALEQTLPPTEFSTELIELLRRCYRPGETMAGAFARWMDALLGPHGLVVFESSDPAAKPLVADIFASELAHPGRTARLAREAGAALRALGHSAQLDPADDLVALFHLEDAGRQSIRGTSGACQIGDRPVAREELVAESRTAPERFSPNVLLRPIVQDALFPTICYVAGPSELAYHAQLGGIYQAFGIERPLLAARASATLLDAAAARFLERSGLPFETLQARDDSALNRLLESLLPPDLERTFDQTELLMSDQVARLRQAVTTIDPTLSGAVDTTLDRMRDTLKTLHNKILQASKKKDETLRRQFVRTRNLTFPDGAPQERVLNVVFFVNRYGPALIPRLIDALPPLPDRHYLITP